MILYEDLSEYVFSRHKYNDSDELVILSGYVGPEPVKALSQLPLSSRVIYGMYATDSIKPNLHKILNKISDSSKNIEVFYSKKAIHSKCYVWRKKNTIVEALLGSANFSINGLRTPLREILNEVAKEDYNKLNKYINFSLDNTIACNEHVEGKVPLRSETAKNKDQNICEITLIEPKSQEVQKTHGLNWGQGIGNHTNKDDACLVIRTSHIRDYPNLFPPKQAKPKNDIQEGKAHRNNDPIEIIWDDGTIMPALLEGSQPVDKVNYPKQISSFPKKSSLGKYIRKRLGLKDGTPIRKHHLLQYGRTNIELSLMGEGIYSIDFSKK